MYMYYTCIYIHVHVPCMLVCNLQGENEKCIDYITRVGGEMYTVHYWDSFLLKALGHDKP